MKLYSYNLTMKANSIALKKSSYITVSDDLKLKTPSELAKLFNDIMDPSTLPEEYMYLLGMNQAGKPVGYFELSHGTSISSMANVGGAMRRLLLMNCTAFALAHNHPSGTLEPSTADIQTTEKFKNAGELVECKLIDHLIITGNGYKSLRNEGMV